MYLSQFISVSVTPSPFPPAPPISSLPSASMLWSGNPPLTFLSDSKSSDHSYIVTKAPSAPPPKSRYCRGWNDTLGLPLLWLTADSLGGWMKKVRMLRVRTHANLIPAVRSERRSRNTASLEQRAQISARKA